MAGANSYEEEAQALEDFLKLAFGFVELAVARCAIELGIPDRVENHPSGVTVANLSSELGSSPSSLHRIMRFLTHRGIFKKVKMEGQDSPTAYAPTAISRLMMKNRMAPYLLLQSSPEMIAAELSLSKSLLSRDRNLTAFELANNVDLWQYTAANPSYSELFNKAMASHAKGTISAVLENHTGVFVGIGSVVDVGGGDGTTLRAVVQACPWITRAINFDLQHVVSSSNDDGCVEHVGGDMFVAVPTADAVLIMSVLHDWDDEACVKILKNCREAIPRETGKVIIVEVVMEDEDNLNRGNNNNYRDLHMVLDMIMMAGTIKGKERTVKEWGNLLASAGFTKHTIKHIPVPYSSVIEAYPDLM